MTTHDPHETDHADTPPSLRVADESLAGTKPVTDSDAKTVMLRAERHDVLERTGVVERFTSAALPRAFTVVQRTTTYYGPRLLLEAADANWLLTAPGPDTQLLLWREHTDDAGYRERWAHAAEITATIADTDQYDVCGQCGNPIRSAEHERLATLGECPAGPADASQ